MVIFLEHAMISLIFINIRCGMHFIAAYIDFVQKLSYNIAKIACANFEEVIACIR